MIAPHEIPRPGPGAALAASLQAMIPVLTTDRTVLRAPRLTDFDTLAAIATGPRSAGIGGPMDRETAWAEFMQLTATWLLRGHGAWTVTQDGAAIGFVLIGFESGDMEPELGFLFSDAAEGRGLAFESANAALAHARDALGMTTLVSYVDRANTRSRALAERLGAAPDPVAGAALDGDTLVYRHHLTAGAS